MPSAQILFSKTLLCSCHTVTHGVPRNTIHWGVVWNINYIIESIARSPSRHWSTENDDKWDFVAIFAICKIFSNVTHSCIRLYSHIAHSWAFATNVVFLHILEVPTCLRIVVCAMLNIFVRPSLFLRHARCPRSCHPFCTL